MSEKWFSYSIVCKKKLSFERYSCLEFTLKNSKHGEGDLKLKGLKLQGFYL